MIEISVQKKLNQLTEILQSYSSVAVAFSGGVDSTFLIRHAHNLLGKKAIAVTAVAPIFSPDEISDAIKFCTHEGIMHLLVNMEEFFLESISHNPVNRCYLCKKNIFQTLLAHPGLKGMVLVDGTNLDDASDFRPGEKALTELGVYSPLREAGLSKEEIRAVLKDLGVPIWDKPAFACLASRIPYGETITVKKLESIYSLETALHKNGFAQVRVRHHGDVARIEVLPNDRKKFFDSDFMDQINNAAKEAGFTYAALDLGGYKMGNMNK